MSTEYKKSNGNGKCPVIHGALTESGDTPTAWWPNNLNLDILHQHDKKTNPSNPIAYALKPHDRHRVLRVKLVVKARGAVTQCVKVEEVVVFGNLCLKLTSTKSVNKVFCQRRRGVLTKL